MDGPLFPGYVKIMPLLAVSYARRKLDAIRAKYERYVTPPILKKKICITHTQVLAFQDIKVKELITNLSFSQLS
jgi:hypothetical protein